MKTFISDIIPKIQRFSQKLDNLTLLTNQHWVVIDNINNNKNVYIFRANNDLLISQNGRVEKAKWEYLGNNSLLIDKKDEIYLFKHGFFDENILALKVDSKDEYAFLINENNYDGDINSLEKVIDFLTRRYIEPQLKTKIQDVTGIEIKNGAEKFVPQSVRIKYETDKGQIEVIQKLASDSPDIGNEVFQYGKLITNGKFRMGFMWYLYIENGKIVKVSLT
jgi:hypothetical protein